MFKIFLEFIRRCGLYRHDEHSRKLGNSECACIFLSDKNGHQTDW